MKAKKCALKFCGEEFMPESSNRQTYCRNPHEFVCVGCGESYEAVVKSVAKRGHLCGPCFRARGQKERQEKLARREHVCQFPGCGKTYHTKASRTKYCAPTHEVACEDCGDAFSVRSIDGPRETCTRCSWKRRTPKTEATNMERYGVPNVFMDPAIKGRALDTLKRNYGVDSPFESPEIVARAQESHLKRHGVRSPMQREEVKAKARETNLERYGTSTASASPEVRGRIEDTNLRRYGARNPLENPEIATKARETNLERYGHESAASSPMIQEKMRLTNLERYGTAVPSASEEVRQRINETNRGRYGSASPMSDPSVQERSRQTCLERYGADNPFKVPEIQQAIKAAQATRNPKSNGKISKLNLRWGALLEERLSLSRGELCYEFPLGDFQVDLQVGNLLLDINPAISHNLHRSYACQLEDCPLPCVKHRRMDLLYHQRRALQASREGLWLLQHFPWTREEETLRLAALIYGGDEMTLRRELLKASEEGMIPLDRFTPSEDQLSSWGLRALEALPPRVRWVKGKKGLLAPEGLSEKELLAQRYLPVADAGHLAVSAL